MRWPKCWSFSYHITVIIYLPVNTFISVSVALSRQLFSHSVMSHSLRLYGLQHTRLPCPSLSPGVCSNSCPLSQWCHPTISSSVFPFSSHLQSFPASGTFPMSRLFTSDGPSIESLASASVLPINIQSWFPLGLTGSPCRPCSPRDSLKSSPTPQFKSISSLVFSLLYGPTLTSVHDYWRNHSFNYTDLCLQNDVSALSGLVIAFHPRSNHLLIWWLQSPSALILEPKKIKSVPVSIVSPSILHEVMGVDAMILVFWMLSFKPTFSHSSFTFIKRFFSSSSLSAIKVVSTLYLRLWILLRAILIPACESSSLAFHMMYSA